MKRTSALLATLVAPAFIFCASAAERGETKPEQKPVKRTTLVAPKAEKTSVEQASTTASSGASRAPAPMNVAAPAPATTEAPRPVPLFREDVTLEEMHRYHQ